MKLSSAEESYIKSIHALSANPNNAVTTNELAFMLDNSPASVTDMLKKLSSKEIIHYKPYYGAKLTEQGHKIATSLIRKNRLWKVFLYQSLNIPWEVVREIAEELEHIHSELLIDYLDTFLGLPKFDPFGEPIPNPQGRYTIKTQVPLAEIQPGKVVTVSSVKPDDPKFLKFLSEKDISIGTGIFVQSAEPYDGSMVLLVHQKEVSVTYLAASQIFVKPG